VSKIENIELVNITTRNLYIKYKKNPRGEFNGGDLFEEIKHEIIELYDETIDRALFVGALKYLEVYKVIRIEYDGAGFLFNSDDLPSTVQPLPQIIDFVNTPDYIKFWHRESGKIFVSYYMRQQKAKYLNK